MAVRRKFKEEAIQVRINSMSEIFELPGIGEIKLERSRKAKRLIIRIAPERGIRVAVPWGVSYAEAKNFAISKTEWLRRHQRKIKQFELESRSFIEQAANIDPVDAPRRLRARLRILADRFGFCYNRVFIRNQRSRWGSCSHGNNINLNIKLIILPQELIDYVLLHELVHTIVKNHSPIFWTELSRYVNNPKTLNKKLRFYKLG